jgi:glycerol-3-phosphate acyltransferase PlsY
MVTRSVLAVVTGYLLGSFPSAYVAARLVKGRDIRDIGGAKVPSTLARRGFIPGLLVFIADVFKGVAAVWLAVWLGLSQWLVLLTGAAAVIGHSWPVFRGFKGGRGGATAYGVLAALSPSSGAIVFFIMLLTLMLTSNGRLSLVAGFVSMPLLMWAFGLGAMVIAFAAALPLLLGTRMLIADRKKLTSPETRRNLIVDHDYTWWQSRKKR